MIKDREQQEVGTKVMGGHVLPFVIILVSVFVVATLTIYNAATRHTVKGDGLQRIAVVGDFTWGTSVVNFIAISGRTAELFSSCDDLDTSLFLAPKQYNGYVIHEDARPASGSRCLDIINRRDTNKPVVCVLSARYTANRSAFETTCLAMLYPTIATQETLQAVDNTVKPRVVHELEVALKLGGQ